MPFTIYLYLTSKKILYFKMAAIAIRNKTHLRHHLIQPNGSIVTKKDV